ncbi:Cloroperoxidase [Mycena maculata]|uniref:Cloroperoxidase n=1 Tax=Mycena maculata TaxID=230809 RepID=A0AAD7HAK8_9AGAR|nr:Cloroperoxidase [Mycena maculata]
MPAEENTGDGDHQWMAPTATDVRSPFPGLNTLANHGYLPRSGKNISIPMTLQAAMHRVSLADEADIYLTPDGFNVGPDAIIQAAKFGLLSGNAFYTTLDLDALALHNLIEHDASTSRNDLAVTGDNLHFNETIFTTLANANPGVDYYNATPASHVQDTRLAISLATNPNITNTGKEFDVRTRESGLYLIVMGNAITRVAPKECANSFLFQTISDAGAISRFVRISFREERMPKAEGWKRSNIAITAETLNPIQDEIFDVSNWTATQACEDLVLGPELTT